MTSQISPRVSLGHIVIAVAALLGGLLAWHPWEAEPAHANIEPKMIGEVTESGGKVRCYANSAAMSCVFIPQAK